MELLSGKIMDRPVYCTDVPAPDQISVIYSIRSGTEYSSYALMKTRGDVQQTLGSNVGVSEYKRGMFSTAESYERMTDSISEKEERVSEVGVLYTTTDATLANDAPLGQLALDIINGLPADPLKNYDDYELFFLRFGTHIWKKVRFGGSIRTTYGTQKGYYLSHSDDDIASQSSALFYGQQLVDLGRQNNGPAASVDNQYVLQTSQRTVYTGGNLYYLEDSQFNSWSSSIGANPSILAGQLTPIWEKIPDPAKQQAMSTALEVYLAKNSLFELKLLLERKINEYAQSRKDITFVYNLHEALRTELDNQTPNLTKMHLLEDEIQHHFIIPSWWENTKLCFESFNRASGQTCSPKGPDEFCPYSAFPNRYIPSFTDNIQNQNCKLEIGLFSNFEHDRWSTELQFCLRKIGDGCWDNEELCTGFNQYLDFDLTRLSQRSDSCRVSWKIKADIRKVPEWFKTTQFCFSYMAIGKDPDVRGSTLCSELNDWTPDYGQNLAVSRCCDIKFGIFNTITKQDIIRPVLLPSEITTPAPPKNNNNNNNNNRNNNNNYNYNYKDGNLPQVHIIILIMSFFLVVQIEAYD
ncbi:perivitellin-2 67 kDa subunit-like [Convolutriloba macropyga]|uniref:perivitellin-2 67 kDa subunit-like n=1 Tax=Convolutriloba macropyga TaxID=536237 RepID=UPI003F521CF4